MKDCKTCNEFMCGSSGTDAVSQYCGVSMKIENPMIKNAEAKPPKYWGDCDFCGKEISEGERYFEYEGDKVHQNCRVKYALMKFDEIAIEKVAE